VKNKCEGNYLFENTAHFRGNNEVRIFCLSYNPSV
jgi:hypothetical protein